MEVTKLEISKIITNPNQPRKHFDEERLQELADSIKNDGLKSPILVRPTGDQFEIVQGERRYRATKLAGLDTIDTFVEELSEEDAFHLAVIENIQREQLTPIEEAQAFLWYSNKGMTQEEIAKKVKKTRDYVASKLRLLSLIDSIQDMIQRGQIKEGHAKQLLRLRSILDRLCTEDNLIVKGNNDRRLDFFNLFQHKFMRHFSGLETISVNDVKNWTDKWYYLLVFASVRQAVGYNSASVCQKSHETKIPMDLSVDNICYIYCLNVENLTSSDIDFAVKFEEELLKHSYDKEFRKWNIEKFYDSIRFREDPLTKEPIKWEKPGVYRFLMLSDSVRKGSMDDEGFPIIGGNTQLYYHLVDEYNADKEFRDVFSTQLFRFLTNHSTLEIEPQTIKEFYLVEDEMKERGATDFQSFMEESERDNELGYKVALKVRLMIEQVYRICDEQKQPRPDEIALTKMLVIDFRETTGAEVDMYGMLKVVRLAMEMEFSPEEIQKMLDEAENVSRDTFGQVK